jgi:hypothetical protein
VPAVIRAFERVRQRRRFLTLSQKAERKEEEKEGSGEGGKIFT